MAEASLGLAIFSIGLTIAGLSQSTETVSSYGIISSFHPLYYVGFGVLMLAFVIEFATTSRLRVLTLEMLLAESYLWIIPVFWLPGLVFPAAYHDLFFYPYIASIVSTGHINPPVYIYQGFPAPYFLTAIAEEVLSPLRYISVARLAPFIINVVVSLFVYVFLRSQLGMQRAKYGILGVMFFELFNFTEQFTTLTPFTAGFLFYYCAIFVMLSLVIKNRNIQSGKIVSLFALLLVALSISQPIIGLLALSGIFGAMVYISKLKGTPNSYMFSILFLFGVMVVAWAVFQTYFISSYFTVISSSFANLFNGLFGATATRYATTSAAHREVVDSKLAILGIIGIIAVPSLIRSILNRSWRTNLLFSVLGGIAVASVLVGGLQSTNFNAYLLAAILPIFILFDLLTLQSLGRRLSFVSLAVILIASAPLSYAALYGNVASESPTSPTLFASVYYSIFSPVNPSNRLSLVGLGLGYFGPVLSSLVPFTLEPNIPNESYFLGPHTQFVALGGDAYLQIGTEYGNETVVSDAMANLQSSPGWISVYSSQNVELFSQT